MSDVLRLGVAWNPDGGKLAGPVTFDLAEGHAFLFGPTRCGKGVTIEMPNALLGLHNTSLISIDPTAQQACVSAEVRRKAGSKVVALNPMGLQAARYPDLASVGCNPMLTGMNPQSPRFYEEAAAICDALAWSDKGDPFWPDSGRALVTGLLMWVRLRDGDGANISTVMQLLMEGERLDEDGTPLKGLRATATEMTASGHYQVEALAGQFLGEGQETISKTVESIQQTARTAARSLLSDPVRLDLGKNGIDWASLTRTPTTVFIILPAEDLEFHTVWLRLIVCSALNAIYRLAGAYRVLTLFWLSEFFALGKLRPIQSAMGQAAKYGVRVFAVTQDWPQLVLLYGDKGALSFISNCACMIAFAAGEPETARFLSDYSGDTHRTANSASQDDMGRISRSYHTVREKLWFPDDLMRIPKHHAFVWFYGDPAPQPVCLAPPYYENPECLRLRPRADPYHSGGAAAVVTQGSGTVRRFAAVAVVVIGAVLFGAWMLAPARVDPPKAHPPAHHQPVKHTR
jgi:type IV secretion system protein VirD4